MGKVMNLNALWAKIREALVSALPVTAIVYLLALTPLFNFSGAELGSFTIGAAALVLGIGMFNLGADLAEMLGKKSLGKGIRITPAENDALVIDCNIVVQFGQAIFDLAKAVQDAVKSSVESITGLTVEQVNVNISGIAITKDAKK